MKLFRLIIAAVLLTIFIAVSLGCTETFYARRLADKQKDLLEEFQEHASAYNRMIVWGDYDGASAAVVSEKRIEFLETAQDASARIRIENFTIPLCKVGTVPFPRDDTIPTAGGAGSIGHLTADDAERDQTPVTPTPIPAPDANEKVISSKEKYKIPKVFYGVALVRYINITVAPSVSVKTRLIKQHWVYIDGAWYCDADLAELLN